MVSNLLLLIGVVLIVEGWKLVYRSGGALVTHGVYRWMRHPQYTGIFVITLGFMIQWPTFPTLILWPFVMGMYVRLARREERDALNAFPDEYEAYREQVPMFVPRLTDLRRAVGEASS